MITATTTIRETQPTTIPTIAPVDNPLELSLLLEVVALVTDVPVTPARPEHSNSSVSHSIQCKSGAGVPDAPEAVKSVAKLPLPMYADNVVTAEDAESLEYTPRENATVADRRVVELMETSVDVHVLAEAEPQILPLLAATTVEKEFCASASKSALDIPVSSTPKLAAYAVVAAVGAADGVAVAVEESVAAVGAVVGASGVHVDD